MSEGSPKLRCAQLRYAGAPERYSDSSFTWGWASFGVHEAQRHEQPAEGEQLRWAACNSASSLRQHSV